MPELKQEQVQVNRLFIEITDREIDQLKKEAIDAGKPLQKYLAELIRTHQDRR